MDRDTSVDGQASVYGWIGWEAVTASTNLQVNRAVCDQVGLARARKAQV